MTIDSRLRRFGFRTSEVRGPRHCRILPFLFCRTGERFALFPAHPLMCQTAIAHTSFLEAIAIEKNSNMNGMSIMSVGYGMAETYTHVRPRSFHQNARTPKATGRFALMSDLWPPESSHFSSCLLPPHTIGSSEIC